MPSRPSVVVLSRARLIGERRRAADSSLVTLVPITRSEDVSRLRQAQEAV